MSAEPSPAVAFAQAVVAFQQVAPKVGKSQTAKVKSDKGSYEYGYADLSEISDAAFPLLAEHGLAFLTRPTMAAGLFVLRYSLLHAGGHAMEGDYPLPDPARSSPQQIGSAITYGRRYCLCAVTGIAPRGEDDDGRHAADARAAEAPSPPPPPVDWRVSFRGGVAKIAKAQGVEEDLLRRGVCWSATGRTASTEELVDDDRPLLLDVCQKINGGILSAQDVIDSVGVLP